jgi:hypothetical protein
MKENKVLEFKAEEIFQDIPGDDKNVTMKIPDEIMEAQGWKEGTKIKVEIGDKGTIIISEVKEEDNQST